MPFLDLKIMNVFVNYIMEWIMTCSISGAWSSLLSERVELELSIYGRRHIPIQHQMGTRTEYACCVG